MTLINTAPVSPASTPGYGIVSEGKNPPQPPEEESGFMSFLKALVDVVNPLQHIPVISTIYRKMTGDQQDPMARLAGDFLYGGAIGLALGTADLIFQSSTGKELGETALAIAFPEKPTPSPRLAAAINHYQPTIRLTGSQISALV